MKQTLRMVIITYLFVVIYPTLSYAVNLTQSINDPESPKQIHAGFWQTLYGKTPKNAILFGLYTIHFSRNSRKHDRDSDNLVGMLYHGFFVGTLLNSFGDRAVVAGWQRDIVQKTFDSGASITAGYRLGAVTGYDHRMGVITKYSPIVPIPQVYIDFYYQHLGVELTYVGVVITGGFVVTF